MIRKLLHKIEIYETVLNDEQKTPYSFSAISLNDKQEEIHCVNDWTIEQAIISLIRKLEKEDEIRYKNWAIKNGWKPPNDG